jgi:hypothetical protein
MTYMQGSDTSSLWFTNGMTATPLAIVARLNWQASDGGSEGMASSIAP